MAGPSSHLAPDPFRRRPGAWSNGRSAANSPNPGVAILCRKRYLCGVMNGIGFWMKNARQVSLPQSMLPVLLAVGMSLRHDSFPSGWPHAPLGVGATGTTSPTTISIPREVRRSARGWLGRYPRPCGEVPLPPVRAPPPCGRTVVAVCVFLGPGRRARSRRRRLPGVVPLALAGIGAVLGISYSGGPLRTGYRRLGEPVVGLLFGPLLMAGVQYTACGVLDGQVLLVGVAVGLLVTSILYTHSMLDRHADSRMGKRTLAHLLGTPRAMIAASGLFCFAPFVLVAAGAGCGCSPRRLLRRSCSTAHGRVLWRSLRSYVLDRPVALRTAGWAPWAISRMMRHARDRLVHAAVAAGAEPRLVLRAPILLVVYTVLEIME